jgi:CubicO group peptidase (beta-lactamase class C family)
MTQFCITRKSGHLALAGLIGVVSTTNAQSTGANPTLDHGGARRDSLLEYQGIYAYHNSSSIALVAGDTVLFAVLDEAKYPLRRLGRDRFLNGAGDTIPFRRDSNGVVSGFVERTVYFPRRSADVDPHLAALVTARPRGEGTRYFYTIPRDLRDGLTIGDLSDGSFDGSDVDRLVNRVVDGTYPDVHSVLVYRRGKLVLEEYFYGYGQAQPHQLRSLTKSVVSALAGIAIDRGLLAGEQELVTRRLPYQQYANPDPRKARLTLRDLLTMQSGLACDDWDSNSPGNESRMYGSEDWVKFILDLPMVEQPGTTGHYCSGNSFTTGRIVERATGKPLPVFAQQELFNPLGIRAADLKWDYRLTSANAASFAQIHLRPRDMLKLGVLYQQQGNWHGRQVISREWIAKSLAPSSTVGDQRYGYLWWHQWLRAATPAGGQRVDMVVATGNGGQKIYLIPSLDMVVVLTGGTYNSDRSPATALMVNEILPAALKKPIN